VNAPGIEEDLALAHACARGEEAAWEDFERRHFAFIRDFARKILPGAAGEDVAGDVISDLWKRGKIARYEGRSTLRTWLGAVVLHAALNAKHSARPSANLEAVSGLAARPGDATPRAERSRLSDMLQDAVGRLSSQERLLLRLHYEQGLSLEQMRPAFARSKAALSRRLDATRASVRRTMESLSLERFGVALAELRHGVDLARWEFDLDAMLEGPERFPGKTFQDVERL